RQRNGIFGLRAVAPISEHPIDGIADGDPGDVSAHPGRDAGEIMARDWQWSRRAGWGVVGDIPLQLIDDDPRRCDAYQDFSRARTRLRHFLVDELVGVAAPMEANRFHPVVLLLLLLLSCAQSYLVLSSPMWCAR